MAFDFVQLGGTNAMISIGANCDVVNGTCDGDYTIFSLAVGTTAHKRCSISWATMSMAISAISTGPIAPLDGDSPFAIII